MQNNINDLMKFINQLGGYEDNTYVCPNCGTLVEVAKHLCYFCGGDVDQSAYGTYRCRDCNSINSYTHCNECGAELYEGDSVCPECGTDNEVLVICPECETEFSIK